MTVNETEFRDPADKLLAARLAGLRTLPVETSGLDSAILAAVPRPHRQWRLGIGAWGGLAAAAAAAIVIIAVLSLSSGPVQASPVQLAALYSQMTTINTVKPAGGIPGMKMSLAPVNSQTPVCCQGRLDGSTVACGMYHDQHNSAVVVMVCNNHTMRHPTGQVVVKNGIRFIVTRAGKINMVARSLPGHWICAIGPQPLALLETYAAKAAIGSVH